MRIRGHLPGDNLGRSERDDAAEEEEVGGCGDFAILGGVGAVATTEVGVFGTGAIDVSLGLASGSFRLKLQLIHRKFEVKRNQNVTYVENEPFSNDLESGVRSGPSCLATGVGFDSSELGMDSSRSSVLSVGVGVSDLSTDTFKRELLKNVPKEILKKGRVKHDPILKSAIPLIAVESLREAAPLRWRSPRGRGRRQVQPCPGLRRRQSPP